tara:strand:- start:180 stop:380 length:201 start_codon:yes stop_codon:yes gene_type:complete
MNSATTWGEDRRIEMSVHHALEHATRRMNTLSGRDRYALQHEYLEWMVAADVDDLDVNFTYHYHSW